jgi:ornithine decarboxylase
MSPQHVQLNKKVKIELVKENPISHMSQKINSKADKEDKDDAFFVADLGNVVRQWKRWKNELPRVDPFYAVKCNDDPAMLGLLARLGSGFDCASKAEIQKVLANQVAPSRIVYANPCKQNSHIRYAAQKDVALMTFDNETELIKIKAVYPDAQLVLRILPPEDTKCQCQLGMKFGVHHNQARDLLTKAYDMGLNVVGVSFHVGSGCYDATAFSAAVALARMVFDMGRDVGFNFTLLDIGGGFPGQTSAKITFEEITAVLRPALDMYFPDNMGVRMIAEPGRYFAAASFHLATNIIAKRSIGRDNNVAEDGLSANDEPKFMYYLNDGVYGSFNCLLFDHAEVTPTLFDPESYEDLPLFESSVWGPTCDGLDCIQAKCLLPELQQEDWLQFRDMGAYTMAAASTFNGMPKPSTFYMMEEDDWMAMNEMMPRAVKVKKERTHRNSTREVAAADIQTDNAAKITA